MTTDEEFREAVRNYCPEIADMDKEVLFINVFNSVFVENSSNLYSSKKVNKRVINTSLTIEWFEDVCTIFGRVIEREPHDFTAKLVIYDSKIPPEYGGSLSGEEDKIYRYTIKKGNIYDIAGCMTSQNKENFVKPPPEKTTDMSRECIKGIESTESPKKKNRWWNK